MTGQQPDTVAAGIDFHRSSTERQAGSACIVEVGGGGPCLCTYTGGKYHEERSSTLTWISGCDPTTK